MAEGVQHGPAAGEVVGAAGGVLLHTVAGVGLLFLDVEHPAIRLPHVRIVGASQCVRVEALVGRDASGTDGGTNELLKVLPIPIASEVAVVDDDGLRRVDQVLDLAYGMDGAELVGRDACDLPSGAVLPQDGFHPVQGHI